MKPDNKAGGPWLYALGLVPVIWFALLIAPAISGGLSEIVNALPAAMNHPFKIVWCEDSIKTVQLIHLAVLPERVADSQWLQQFYRVVVFLPGNGEWNRNLPIFRVLGAAQHRLDYIAHSDASLPASMTAFPCRTIRAA